MSDEERRGLDLPDRRVNTYESLSNRLDYQVGKIAHRFQKRYRGMLIAFSIIGITSALALGGFGLVLKRLTAARVEFVRNGCESTNERHDNTTKALRAAAAKDIENAKKNAANSQSTRSVKEIKNRRDVTLGLIDLLVPKEDCDYRVKLYKGEVSPTPVPKPPSPPKEVPTP